MKKSDFRKELKHLYQPSAKAVEEVTLPPMNFLMIDGEGDPNIAREYAAAVEALFAVSYAAKFLVKRGKLAVDYGVMPLEGLWWADDMKSFSVADKGRWKWTMMIMQPAIVSMTLVERALTEVKGKKDLAALSKIRFAMLAEGRCAQVMHLGPFSAEGPTVEKVHEFITERNGTRVGKHHEIYLSDIRKASPAKWKTIVRQPFSKT